MNRARRGAGSSAGPGHATCCVLRVELVMLSGSAHPALAAAVARELDGGVGECLIETFPDGEVRVRVVEEVSGADVFIVQPTGPVASAHVLELLLLADACRRAGAWRVTAVVPYFGYARQDRRTHPGEPVAARLLADLLGAGGLARVVAVDLHAAALEACFPMPILHLSAVPLLARSLRAELGRGSILVSPDLGAAKLAQSYARCLDLPVAMVQKSRLSGSDVDVHGVAGDVRGMRPVIVDDMLSTGGTVAAAAAALLDHGCVPEITVVATHGLLVGPARERLAALPLRRLLTTDTLPAPSGLPFAHEVVGVAPLLAEGIARLHREVPTASMIAP